MSSYQQISIDFQSSNDAAEGVLCLAVFKGKELSGEAKVWDDKTGGLLSKAMASGTFEGKKAQTLVVTAPADLTLSHFVLLGVGEKGKLSDKDMESLGGHLTKVLHSLHAFSTCVHMDSVLDKAQSLAQVALGALLRSWHFPNYFTKKQPHELPALRAITFVTDRVDEAQAAFAPLKEIAEGVFFTRHLVSEPANVINPVTLAQQAKALEKVGVKVTILEEPKLKELGMNALLGVGQGSVVPSQVVLMEYNGAADKSEAPVALVGKGVTFDTGGISIKPAANMEDMKWDMGGSAVVMGVMRALAGRKAKVNVVGAVGLVENMPSGSAQRPGDVVTSMSGQTIEVINTDAEGRLVLADVLWYTQETYKPKAIVDLATLTGAIIVSLGMERAGMFDNDADMAHKIFEAGEAVGEGVWRLPMDGSYDKEINSPIADMKNMGSGRGAGSITAAKFLERFIQKGTPWVHLDIAGVTFETKDTTLCAKGATGFGVRLLERFIADNHEG